MALNEHLRHADHITLPVAAGTKSGDPVRVGVLNGVAQTARSEGGNVDGEASVWLTGSHYFPVTGAVAAVGDPVYIADGKLAAAKGVSGVLFGAALSTQPGDGTIPVKIIQAQA